MNPLGAWFPRPLALVAAIYSAAAGEAIQDPMDDAASVEYERFYDMPSEDSALRSDPGFDRIATTVFFPLGHAWERECLGGIKAEVLDRAHSLDRRRISGPAFQRYTLYAGMEVVKAEKQESLVMVSAGYGSDFRRIDGDGLGWEGIYSHYFMPRPGLKLGIGLDLMRYFDAWYPFPLLFLDWRMLDRTALRANGDVLELRQFLGGSVCVTLGIRYNLFYGSLGRSETFQLEAFGWEEGIEYRLRKDLFLRLKLKQFFWGANDFTSGSRAVISDPAEGGSLRLALAYAL